MIYVSNRKPEPTLACKSLLFTGSISIPYKKETISQILHISESSCKHKVDRSLSKKDYVGSILLRVEENEHSLNEHFSKTLTHNY